MSGVFLFRGTQHIIIILAEQTTDDDEDMESGFTDNVAIINYVGVCSSISWY